MSQDPKAAVLSHIEFLVGAAAKKGARVSSQEREELTETWGRDAEVHLVVSLFKSVDWSAEPRSSQFSFSGQYLNRLFSSCATCKWRPGFLSSICEGFERARLPSPPPIGGICQVLRFTKAQEVVFSLALLDAAEQPVRAAASKHLCIALPLLLRTYVNPETCQDSGLRDCAVEVLHLILSSIEEDQNSFGVSAQLRDSFVCALKRDLPPESVPAIVLPWLSPSERKSERVMDFGRDDVDLGFAAGGDVGLARQLLDIGYVLLASDESCRRHLKLLNGDAQLTPAVVASVLAMMVETHSGLRNSVPMPQAYPGWAHGAHSFDVPVSWNVEVFAKVVNELAPSLNWSEVVMQLDRKSFRVRDRAGLSLLTRGLLEGLGQNVFPIALLYRDWNFHKSGQLSWILQILKQTDVFSFADHPHRPVLLDALKQAPDDPSRDAANWKSLDLIEILLKLSDVPGLYADAAGAFEYPKRSCPDVLALGLLQMMPPINHLRQELLQYLVLFFLGTHPNSTVILNFAWNTTIHSVDAMRQLILHSMSVWYMRDPDDTSKLARILEIAHELKPNGLTALFNNNHHQFVIDLACLASRRDYLKLDKFLSDKMKLIGEAFVSACLQFLKRKLPSAGSAQLQLPADVLAPLLGCLHDAAPNVSSVLASEISLLITSCQQLMGKPAAPAPFAAADSIAGHKTPTPTPLAAFSSVPFAGAPQRPPLTALDALSSAVARPTTFSFTSSSRDPMGLTGGLGLTADMGPSKPFGVQSSPYGGSGGGGFAGGMLGGPSLGAPFLGSQQQQQQQQMHSLSPARSMLNSMPMGGGGGGSSRALFRPAMSGSDWPTTAASVGGMRQAASTALSFGGDPALGAGSGGGNDQPDLTCSYPAEIQEESNHYFQQIYTQPPQQSMSIGDFVSKLRQFRDSPHVKDNSVFACMLKNLFEEFRFFSEYPDRELYTTALVYGGIVRENIVSGFPLAHALRIIMMAVSAEPTQKLYQFGVTALQHCRTRLKEYPRYSHCLASLRSFNTFPEDLIEYVQEAVQGRLPKNVSDTPSRNAWAEKLAAAKAPAVSAGGGAASAAASKAPSLPVATNISTLVSATEREESQVAAPPERVVEKVAFLFNNLSQANLKEKVAEFKVLINASDGEYFGWLAQYLVMKRVSIEPNFHLLYSNFISNFGDRDFEELVSEETFRNIRILLRSDKRKAVHNFGDRQLLKNLGHWLGMITLARDKPIMHEALNVKALVMEAYYKGQQELLYVVPFVAKILESCSKSTVFHPKGAWATAIICLLAEIHGEADLKLNLKFEIEVLCKALNVDLQDVEIQNILKDTDRLVNVQQQLGDFSLMELSQPAETATAPTVGPSPSVADQRSFAEAPPTAAVAATASPPPARFSYHDINVTSFAGLAPHIDINHALQLFQLNPPIKNLVRPAIEHAVRELITPVTDRAIKVACTTTEHVMKKDFALESDETKMQAAAHHMMRSLTAGMAMITCREPVLSAMQGYLRQAFASTLRGANDEQQKMIDDAAAAVAEANVELAQNFIVKTACEKAAPEIDRRIDAEMQKRVQARRDRRVYTEPTAAEQAEHMPDALQLAAAGASPPQLAVYEQFSSNISGFKPTTADDLILPVVAAAALPALASGIELMYQQLVREIDKVFELGGAPGASKAARALSNMRDHLQLASQTPCNRVSAHGLLQKLVEIMLTVYQAHSSDQMWMAKLREAFCLAIRIVQQACGGDSAWLQSTVTKVLVESQTDCRYNLDAVDQLIRQNLVNMVTYDLQLAGALQDGLNFAAIQFAQRLVKLYFVDDQGVVSQTDLSRTIDALSHMNMSMAQTARPPTEAGAVTNLLDMLRMESGGGRPTADLNSIFGPTATPSNSNQLYMNTATSYGGYQAAPGAIGQPVSASNPQLLRSLTEGSAPISSVAPQTRFPSDDDPADLQNKVELILRKWIELCYSPETARDPTAALSTIVNKMHEQGVLRNDDIMTRFFRLCTEMCVDLTYKMTARDPAGGSAQTRRGCFQTLDAFAKLAALMVKFSANNDYTTKVNLLKKVLAAHTDVLLQDHEVRRSEFHHLPFQRIFIQLFWELTAPDPYLDPVAYDILDVFGHVSACSSTALDDRRFRQALYKVQPTRAPGFAYAWLDIVGHRTFIGRMLPQTTVPRADKTWTMYTQLMVCHLNFLAPFLRNIDLPKPIALMYKGTLRVLLVLLHDFPELLCEHHYTLCEAIPPNCVQLRNLVLSAYPRNMRLPDPFMPNLKVDQLAEITLSPTMQADVAKMMPDVLKSDLDAYLENRSPVSFLTDLRSKLQTSQAAGAKYKVSLMNAVVVYVGMRAIAAITDKQQRATMSTIAHTSFMDIFQNLAVSLDTEGRYLFFNAIANQLRYPNSHTHYFSCTLLYLFLEANCEVIQEQITRILFERLVALRPHPWGLLITFIELIKNKQYGFWNHEFTRCAPEIERLFQSVAASCMGTSTVRQADAQPPPPPPPAQLT